MGFEQRSQRRDCRVARGWQTEQEAGETIAAVRLGEGAIKGRGLCTCKAELSVFVTNIIIGPSDIDVFDDGGSGGGCEDFT